MISESVRLWSSEELCLGGEEIRLLRKGLMEWSGPARASEKVAIVMGFPNVESIAQECRSLKERIVRGESLNSTDWTRVLLATELAFVSDIVGSGVEWATTTGWPDDITIAILRSVQRKLVEPVAAAQI